MNFRTEKRRIVALAEGQFDFKNAKTACGVIRYGFHNVVAVIDRTKSGKTVEDVVPGIGSSAPIVSSLEQTLKWKPDCLLIGVAPRGGGLPPEWKEIILRAIAAGCHIYSGLHIPLSSDPEISAMAKKHDRIIWDIRKPEPPLPVALGKAAKARSFIVETVGTDCAVGKMTASLEILRGLRKKGVSCEFIATGQTGMIISGWGQPVDAIPGDFMAGVVEREVMKLDGKVDVILVEGQGSLIHPGYSSVTMAILHGAAPDALILCHQSTRLEVARGYKIPIPPLKEAAGMYETAAGWIKPAPTIAVALNTFGLEETAARRAIEESANESEFPTADPVRFGSNIIVDAIVQSMEKYIQL